jgi:hypothetical protein
MTKNDARIHLDRLKEGQFVRLSLTTAALQATGDIPGIPDKPLRTNGNEPQIDRSCQVHGQTIQNEFSWSGYLDSQTVERNQC